MKYYTLHNLNILFRSEYQRKTEGFYNTIIGLLKVYLKDNNISFNDDNLTIDNIKQYLVEFDKAEFFTENGIKKVRLESKNMVKNNMIITGEFYISKTEVCELC